MFALKALLVATVTIIACRALAVDYTDMQMMDIGDLFNAERNNTILVQNIDSVERFQQLHPELTLEELDVMSNVRGQMVYTLGARTRGDRLVGTSSKNQSWPTPQNVRILLTYPSRGVGALVTYVYIVINQSTKLGRAYVAQGGLHQRFITVVVEAYSTTFANYHTEIYGI